MRSPVWSSLLLASYVCCQETVTVCESYQVTGISTFTEYTPYYVTNGAIGGIRPSTTVGGSTASLRSFTLPSASTSSSLTNGGTGGSRSSTTMTTSKSALIPDDNEDPVTPTTPIPTSSQTTTLTGSSTIGTTNPTVTSGTFVVAFNVRQADRGSPTDHIINAYLAFDDSQHSTLVSNSTEAAPLYLVDGILESGSLYVAVDDDSEPPRFLLQADQPSEPVQISIENGIVSLSGIDSYCQLGEQLVVIETGEEVPTECSAATPQLIPRSTNTSSISLTTSGSSSSASSGITTTSSGTTSISPASSSGESMTSSSADSTTSVSSATSPSSSEPTVTSSVSTSLASFSSSSSTTSYTTSILADEPVVTNQAYIDTILRHHNRHRANHTADPLTWNDAMAATAKKIADTCVYGHVIDTDCPDYAETSCYGQNIGAGYLPTQMGAIISDGFYNGEVNHYTYYGEEPDDTTLHEWGHFTQIVWKGTSSVGCYTSNCTATGLGKIDPASGIRPYFTVCNYQDPGNYLGEFTVNVIKPLNYRTITANYGCPSDDNCEDQRDENGNLIDIDIGIGGGKA